jgi:cell division protein FtsL
MIKFKKTLLILFFIINLSLLVFIIFERNKSVLISYEIKKLNEEFLKEQNINFDLKNKFANISSQEYLSKKAKELGLNYKIKLFYEKAPFVVAK